MRSRLYALPVAVLALYTTGHAANSFKQDLQFTGIETEVSFWGRGDYLPTEATIRRTNQSMDKLLHNTPGHSTYLSLQANSYTWQAYWEEDSKTTRELSEKAVQLQTFALHSRPAHLQSRAKLNEYLVRLQDAQ